MNHQYNDDSRPMRLSAAYVYSGHCELRRWESLYAGITIVLHAWPKIVVEFSPTIAKMERVCNLEGGRIKR